MSERISVLGMGSTSERHCHYGGFGDFPRCPNEPVTLIVWKERYEHGPLAGTHKHSLACPEHTERAATLDTVEGMHDMKDVIFVDPPDQL